MTSNAVEPETKRSEHERDRVLCRFMADCPIPTIEDYEAWIARHPQHQHDLYLITRALIIEDMKRSDFDEPENVPTKAQIAEWDRRDEAMATAIIARTSLGASPAQLVDTRLTSIASH